MTLELGSFILILEGLCWMGLVIYYAALAVDWLLDPPCRHERETILATAWSVWKHCPDCERRVRLGSVMSSAWCHATVKRRDAA